MTWLLKYVKNLLNISKIIRKTKTVYCKQMFAYFKRIFRCKNKPHKMVIVSQNLLRNLLHLVCTYHSSWISTSNFTFKVLKMSYNNTALGPHNISYKLLVEGCTFELLKRVPILKHDREPYLTRLYRPLSLLFCLLQYRIELWL